jgi:nucleoside-diphosphate-sugar epimerase
MMTKQVISVIGGTGLQGGGVVDALLAQGTFKVRVASRNPASDGARALSARGIEVVKPMTPFILRARRRLRRIDPTTTLTLSRSPSPRCSRCSC